MAFNSSAFLFFVFIVILVYFLVPKRYQWIVLLAASYFFYIFSAGKLVFFLLITTITTFFAGILLGKSNDSYEKAIKDADHPVTKEEKSALSAKNKRKKSLVLIVVLLLNFGILAVLKYSNFLTDSFIRFFSLFPIDVAAPTFHLILPLGISFYTFQSMGYIIDVYRGKIQPDRHIGKFALFVSFFPQIVQGPISRYSELAAQLYEEHRFEYIRAKFGFQLILWGLFKKMVIADRMAVAVNTVFKTFVDLPGTTTFLGAVMYSLQIYCDFSGGIDIARGIAQILGINMPENFKRPFFATSISDFWRRWHISLSSWMRDYIFYPISLSKSFARFGKNARKIFGNYVGKMLPTMVAMVITFLVVGIWHGAAWNFVAYGLYNAFFIILGIFFGPLLTNYFNKKKFRTQTFSWRFYQMVITFILVAFGRFFSRADGCMNALRMIKRSIVTFKMSDLISGKFLELGLSSADWIVLVIALIILFVVEILQENGIYLREKIAEQGLVFRWTLYLGLIFAILIFGIYGVGFNSTKFIYMGF